MLTKRCCRTNFTLRSKFAAERGVMCLGKKMDIESALNELKSAGLIARFDEKNVRLKEQKTSISVIIKKIRPKTAGSQVLQVKGKLNSQHLDELEASC